MRAAISDGNSIYLAVLHAGLLIIIINRFEKKRTNAKI